MIKSKSLLEDLTSPPDFLSEYQIKFLNQCQPLTKEEVVSIINMYDIPLEAKIVYDRHSKYGGGRIDFSRPLHKESVLEQDILLLLSSLRRDFLEELQVQIDQILER